MTRFVVIFNIFNTTLMSWYNPRPTRVFLSSASWPSQGPLASFHRWSPAHSHPGQGIVEWLCAWLEISPLGSHYAHHSSHASWTQMFLAVLRMWKREEMGVNAEQRCELAWHHTWCHAICQSAVFPYTDHLRPHRFSLSSIQFGRSSLNWLLFWDVRNLDQMRSMMWILMYIYLEVGEPLQVYVLGAVQAQRSDIWV